MNVSLAPGGVSLLDPAQRAKVNVAANIYAKGNVYNALQYQGDLRSLIEYVFTGSGNDSVVGNGQGNQIRSGAGNDILYGKHGVDVLYGGAGSDTFVLDTPLNGTNNVDHIKDFDPVADSVRLSRVIFTTLAAGNLAAGAFQANATGTATQSDDRIVYNTTTGDLYYDADGSGAGAAIKFAAFSTTVKPVLSAADFIVV